MSKVYLGLISVFFLACNHIETGKTLGKSDIEYIRRLDLLEPGEELYKFYSESSKKQAGNFFTNKRIAMYWIDDRHKEKDDKSYAFYPDIASIDTVYNAGASYSPYMQIVRKDGSKFKVCANGKREEIRAFFEDAIQQWKKHR